MNIIALHMSERIPNVNRSVPQTKTETISEHEASRHMKKKHLQVSYHKNICYGKETRREESEPNEYCEISDNFTSTLDKNYFRI